MPTPTRRFMNWTGVTFTPTSGSPANFTGVTSVGLDSGGSLLKFDGDGDRYPTTVVNDFNDPVLTIEAADIGAIRSFPVGTPGIVTATLNDAVNKAVTGGGALLFTYSNAVVMTNPFTAAHRQYASGTVTFSCFSSDGVTNPTTVTTV